ncbi:MAG: carbon-nitrogen hydrolase family protein [Alcanivorax sp.]|nr:carbon-nitrogen hydrolase family protein [Alcanivorax sp.]
MKSLRVATCQFPVEPDIASNLRYTLRQIRQSARQGARVIHFSECSLSGYAGVEFPDMSHLDWEALVAATESIQQAARETGTWVVLGSTHRLTGRHKPHNCLYLIDPEGEIVDRYDKRFCTGTGGRHRRGSPGDGRRRGPQARAAPTVRRRQPGVAGDSPPPAGDAGDAGAALGRGCLVRHFHGPGDPGARRGVPPAARRR